MEGNFETPFICGERVQHLSETKNKSSSYAGKLLLDFCKKDIERLEAQNLIGKITKEILTNFFKDRDLSDNENMTLIPILRAGLPMWVEANSYFKNHDSSFISCQRIKATEDVLINWLTKPVLDGREIILLDTVLATGKTIDAVSKKIQETNKVLKLSVISCYASPQAIDLLMSNGFVNNLYIGIISESVDNAGYLIPSTNGDVGNKCFGGT